MEQNNENRLNMTFDGLAARLSLSRDTLRIRYSQFKKADDSLQNFVFDAVLSQKEFDLIVSAYNTGHHNFSDETKKSAKELGEAPVEIVDETAVLIAEATSEASEARREVTEASAKYEALLARHTEATAKYESLFTSLTSEVSEVKEALGEVSAKYEAKQGEVTELKAKYQREASEASAKYEKEKTAAIELLKGATGNTEGVLLRQIEELKNQAIADKTSYADAMLKLAKDKDAEIDNLGYQLSFEKRQRSEDMTAYLHERDGLISLVETLKAEKTWYTYGKKIAAFVGSFSAANILSMGLGFLGMVDKFGVEGIAPACILIIVFTAIIRYLKSEFTQSAAWGLVGIAAIEAILGYIHKGYFFNILVAKLPFLYGEELKAATEGKANEALFFAIIVSLASFYSAFMTWVKTSDVQENARIETIDNALKVAQNKAAQTGKSILQTA